MNKYTSMYLVSAIFLVAIIGFVALNIDISPGSATGGTVLSCTNPKVISGDSEIAGNNTWSCLFAGTNYGQGVHYTLTSDEAFRLFGVRTEHEADIYPEVINPKCVYKLQNQSTVLSSIKTAKTSPIQASSSNTCNYCKCSSQFTSDTTKGCYQGNFGSSYCNPSDRKGYDCIQASNYGIGSVYELETGVTDYDLKVKMILDTGEEYETIVNWKNIASKVNDNLRVQLQGDLAGPFDCPSPNVVAYIPNNESKIYLKSKTTWTAVSNNQLALPSDTTGLYYEANRQNQLVNSFIGSSPTFSQYCIPDQTSLISDATSAQFTCTPISLTRIPVFMVHFNGDLLGVHIPSSQPQILNTTASKAESANLVNVSVLVKNIGTERDTFTASLQCKEDYSPFSAQESIAPGETKPIYIKYSGAGRITTCNVSVKSVNSPQNIDSDTVKLIMEPYCGKPQPNPLAIKVNTEKGCFWICPKYGEKDVLDTSCQEILTYDRCAQYEEVGTITSECAIYAVKQNGSELYYYPKYGSNYQGPECDDAPECQVPLPKPTSIDDEIVCKMSKVSSGGCLEYLSYSGYHCTDIGKYMTMDNYLDAVYEEEILPFVPEIKQHKYFIVSDQGEKKCQYVNEFGYDSSGSEISEFTYNPSLGISSASQETYVSNITTNKPTKPATTENNDAIGNFISDIGLSGLTGILQVIIGIIGLALTVASVIFAGKKMRK